MASACIDALTNPLRVFTRQLTTVNRARNLYATRRIFHLKNTPFTATSKQSDNDKPTREDCINVIHKISPRKAMADPSAALAP
jgi:hypothetical protein